MNMIDKIEAETFVHESEDEEKVKSAFLSILSIRNLLKKETKVSFGTRIKILSSTLTKKEEISEFIDHLRQKIDPESTENLKRTIEKRIDNKGNLCLRFDKQTAFTKKSAHICESDDCIFVKIHFRSSPSKRYKFIEEAREILL